MLHKFKCAYIAELQHFDLITFKLYLTETCFAEVGWLSEPVKKVTLLTFGCPTYDV